MSEALGLFPKPVYSASSWIQMSDHPGHVVRGGKKLLFPTDLKNIKQSHSCAVGREWRKDLTELLVSNPPASQPLKGEVK